MFRRTRDPRHGPDAHDAARPQRLTFRYFLHELQHYLHATDAENRWMGDMRDRVADRMREGARDVASRPARPDGGGDQRSSMH